eukprot:TRINITY_DN5874_c0_g2_i1.p1 TRINITY_DN5874_c0_g2~~TRINITY_DN5874_c0_g2_i1.p1  ORF type:complete len:592 (+),score=104.02 TRINITY_DN5874_c0_g2_i1:96-1871(+)
MIRRPPRSTLSSSSAASDVYKRQAEQRKAAVMSKMSRQRAAFKGNSTAQSQESRVRGAEAESDHLHEVVTCVLCQEELEGEGEQSWGFCGMLEMIEQDEAPRLHSLLCGHALHATCLESFQANIRARHMNSFHPYAGEYSCPMCRRLCNTLLPAYPIPDTNLQPTTAITQFEPWRSQLQTWCMEGESVCILADPVVDFCTEHWQRCLAQVPEWSELQAWDALVAQPALAVQHFHRSAVVEGTDRAWHCSASQNQSLRMLLAAAAQAGCRAEWKQRVQQFFRGESGMCDGTQLVVALWVEQAELNTSPLNFCFCCRLVLPLVMLQAAVQIATSGTAVSDVPARAFTETLEGITDRTVLTDPCQSRDFMSEVALRCLPFIRCCIALHAALLQTTTPAPHPCFNLETSAIAESDTLLQMLGSSWELAVQDLELLPRLDSVRPLEITEPARLIELPSEFTQLFLQYNESTCLQCGSIPEEPALCLVTGSVLCCGACTSSPDQGPLTRYAAESGGVGLFLLLRVCTVLVVLPGKRCATWGSLYLDAHGEEDPCLRRGKRVTLSSARLQSLTRVWARRGWFHDSHTLGHMSKMTSVY